MAETTSALPRPINDDATSRCTSTALPRHYLMFVALVVGRLYARGCGWCS